MAIKYNLIKKHAKTNHWKFQIYEKEHHNFYLLSFTISKLQKKQS